MIRSSARNVVAALFFAGCTALPPERIEEIPAASIAAHTQAPSVVALPVVEAPLAARYTPPLDGETAEVRGAFASRRRAELEPIAESAGALRRAARYRLAELFVDNGDFQRARPYAESLEVDGWRKARALAARVALKTGRDEEGLAIYRAIVAQRKSGWSETAFAFARALTARPSEAHNREAAEVLDDLFLEGPKSSWPEAKKERDRARSTLPRPTREALEQRLPTAAVATKLAATGRAKEALVLLERSKQGGCEIDEAKGRALEGVKRHAEAGEAYLSAFATCGEDRRSELRYRGARALARGGQKERAIGIFEEVEKNKDDRFADDALLERAKTMLARGDREASLTLLATMPARFPSGDMNGEGMVLFATERGSEGAWAAIDKALAAEVRDTPKTCDDRGRIDYFRGRAKLELGDVTGAKLAFVRAIRSMPLGYQSALSAASLSSFGGFSADVFPTASSSFPSRDTPMFSSPQWKEIEAVARAGDAEITKALLEEAGIFAWGAAPEDRAAGAMIMSALDVSDAQRILRAGCDVHDAAFAERLSSVPLRSTGTSEVDPLWRILYPRAFEPLVEAAASREGIPVSLVFAIMREESAFLPKVVSRTGAVGLMQLMPGTAATIGRRLRAPYDRAALENPEDNIRLGSNFLATLRKRFVDRELLAIPSYNAGPLAIEKWDRARFDIWVERIPYAETRAYTRRVVGSFWSYAVLHDAGMLGAREPLSSLQLALRDPPP